MGLRRKDREQGGPLRLAAGSPPLAARLAPGDVAVIDLVDLDAPTAQLLLDRRVAAVVNASPSSSGRYPNAGPALLVGRGIPLLDDVGHGALVGLREGARARVEGDALLVDGATVARGMRQDDESVALAASLARGRLGAQLADLVGRSAQTAVVESDLLLGGEGSLPAVELRAEGRAALIVGPSYGAAEELAALRRFRRRRKPLLIGVDGGGDVLLAQGLTPDLLVGDPDTMSDEALRGAGSVVLRAGAPGLSRVQDLAVPTVAVASGFAAEDLALLLLGAAGASVVVTAGLPRDLEELIDRGRAAASSPLVRVQLGARLVPAGAVPGLVPRRSWGLPALALLLAAMLAVSVGVGHEELLRTWRDLVS